MPSFKEGCQIHIHITQRNTASRCVQVPCKPFQCMKRVLTTQHRPNIFVVQALEIKGWKGNALQLAVFEERYKLQFPRLHEPQECMVPHRMPGSTIIGDAYRWLVLVRSTAEMATSSARSNTLEALVQMKIPI